MLSTVEELREKFKLEFDIMLDKMTSVSLEGKAVIKGNFYSQIKFDQHVWVLYYCNIFSVAMAEKHKINVNYAMEALAHAINHHYARVFAEEQGIAEKWLYEGDAPDSDSTYNDDDDDRDVRKRHNLD